MLPARVFLYFNNAHDIDHIPSDARSVKTVKEKNILKKNNK